MKKQKHKFKPGEKFWDKTAHDYGIVAGRIGVPKYSLDNRPFSIPLYIVDLPDSDNGGNLLQVLAECHMKKIIRANSGCCGCHAWKLK